MSLTPLPSLIERGEEGAGEVGVRVTIRPELHAPEVDEYDEILDSDIIGKIKIGSYVEYIRR